MVITNTLRFSQEPWKLSRMSQLRRPKLTLLSHFRPNQPASTPSKLPSTEAHSSDSSGVRHPCSPSEQQIHLIRPEHRNISPTNNNDLPSPVCYQYGRLLYCILQLICTCIEQNADCVKAQPSFVDDWPLIIFSLGCARGEQTTISFFVL